MTADEAIEAQGAEIDRLCKMLFEKETEIARLRAELASRPATQVVIPSDGSSQIQTIR